jgi:plasmid stabilization system protein ParE
LIRTYAVRVAPPVYEDLEAIRSYIAISNPLNADRYVDRIVEAIDHLCTLPHVWITVPTAKRKDIRQLTVGSHRVVYRVVEESGIVEVFGVAHARQHLGLEWLRARTSTG